MVFLYNAVLGISLLSVHATHAISAASVLLRGTRDKSGCLYVLLSPHVLPF